MDFVNWKPKGTRLAVAVLCWVLLLHVAGVYLFTRGFLLTRMALSNISVSSDEELSLPATHQRLVLLVIDALRFDFVAPEPPEPSSPFHHHVLSLPQELTRKDPSRSFLFNAHSDPPTTTMQRIKGITTGSLPTFVDMSANFGATSIDEDSLINQFHRVGKRCAFMGDDTWMSVFPSLFSPDMTHPYDSFNVEDLHSVDEGVIRHLFPLLEDESQPWDVIIGHFLGVDHVGHRVGPDHSLMKEKLLQMDRVLRRVVDLLADDTLLVVLGDHGMDRKGDHGGDDIFETSSAMWIYSKGPALRSVTYKLPILPPLIPNATYPGAPAAHRWIQQIDIVPTISLLLGLPIPFNNLGTVIPEVFYRFTGGGRSISHSTLDRAMKLNAIQIKNYLDTYHGGPTGRELDSVWGNLQASWSTTTMPGENDGLDMASRYFFNRYALEVCRSLWAQFNVVLMSVGLVVLGVGLFTVSIVYSRLSEVTDWEKWASKKFGKIFHHSAVGAALGTVAYFPLNRLNRDIGLLDLTLLLSSMASCVALILDTTFSVTISPSLFTSLPVILLLHALCFLSNSFTFWEDRILPFLLISCLIPAIRAGLTAPDRRLQRRIIGFSALYAVCVRLMAVSTVCREEQQPYCHVTFYSSSSLSSPPLLVLAMALPTSLVLPSVIRRFLATSASDKGLAPSFLSLVLRPALLAGNVSWILEWLESSEMVSGEWNALLRPARTVVARCAFGGLLVVASSLWWLNCLCVDVRVLKKPGVPGPKSAQDEIPKVTVVVNSNSYGSPYVLFWCIGLSLVYITTQLAGQVVLGLAAISLLCHLEISDSVRDVESLNKTFSSSNLTASLDAQSSKSEIQGAFTFGQVTPIALLALHTYHATGHQATLSSLQWKTAFLLTPQLSYPVSPLLVILNTFGSHLLFSLAAPLLAVWQFAPTPSPKSRAGVTGGSVRACIGLILYFGALLFSSAVSAAWLRRHLMVWKVFAPRYMAAAAGLLVVDLGAILAIGIGVHRSSGRIAKLLQNMEQSGKSKVA